MANVRGNSFNTINRWLTKKFTADEYELFIAKLKPDIVQVLTQAESRLWYSLDHLTEIYNHISTELGNGDDSILEDLGRYLAETDLGGVLKPLIMFISIPQALKRTPKLWPRYDDSGEFKLALLDEDNKKAVLELADYDGGEHHCVIIRSWMKRGCELLGGKDVEIKETLCRWQNGGHVCRWEITWN